MSQYVVTYFPDYTLVVAAIGPFHSLERAEAVKDELDALEDGKDEAAGEIFEGRGTQIVELTNLETARADYE